MKLFDVYPLFDINIVKGKGCHVWDDQVRNTLICMVVMRLFLSVTHIHIMWK